MEVEVVAFFVALSTIGHIGSIVLEQKWAQSQESHPETKPASQRTNLPPKQTSEH